MQKKYYGHPRFYELLEELKELHSNKNRDYSGEVDPLRNLRSVEAMGLPAWKGVVVRLTDKLNRLWSFSQKEEYAVKDESLVDTLKDTAVYAILGIVLYEETLKKRK